MNPPDRSAARLACLPVGRAWTEAVRRQFDELLEGLPERIRVEEYPPVSTEVGVLEQTDRLRAVKPHGLLLPALHGGSARALVLAARKAGIPALLWCHDEKHSLASSCLAMEALRQLGQPSLLIHGEKAIAARELTEAAVAAGALRRLAEARIGQIGPLHPNLLPCEVNPLAIHRRFGSWVVPISLGELRRKAAALDPGDVSAAADRLRARYAVKVEEQPLQSALSLHLALERMAVEHRLDAIAIDCWTEILPEFGVSPCVGFAFDGYRIACERDLALAVTLIAGEAITGSPGYTGDLYSFDEENSHVVSMHCGACAALHSGETPAAIVTESPPGTVSVQGKVLSCRPVLPPGPGTLVILHGMDLERIQVRDCELLETEFSEQMRVHLRIAGDPASFRAQAAGNHYVFFRGPWASAWGTLARWLGLELH